MESQDVSAEKTMIAQAPGAEATIIGTPVKCPVCETENAPTEKYCGECGFLLSSTPIRSGVELEYPTAPCRLVDPASGREFPLKEGENSIGRESTDVLLADPTVSRRHAVLTVEADKCWIEDLGSTNGTYVAGTQLQPGERTELSDGTELKVGSAVLTVRISPVEAPPAEEVSEPPMEEAAGAAEEEVIAEARIEEVEEVAAAEPAPVARLVDSAGTEYLVMPGTNAIGRREGNAIVLPDLYVSGSHAELVADETGFWITDLGSTNGSVLNRTKLVPGERMSLNDGDEIVFGQTAMRFEVVEVPGGLSR
jgi:pSer/pThr/pTyr-binding forkhead associated (FHA) protein